MIGLPGLSGCLSLTDETESVELLYIMLTTNLVQEQEIKLEVVSGPDHHFSMTVEMPPIGTDSSEVPGTTTTSQFMIVPDTSDLTVNSVLRARYPDADSWVETALTDADHRHVAGWITLWSPAPTVEYVEYPEKPNQESGAVEGAGITVSEAEEFVDSFMKEQADRDYTVDD
ncbi:hypothetical protein AArcSl_1651 [Halalkaliarchaeum desulfuricum]|uniref:Uncharacterized protein n=1 Tax=Halalkaliarchaeum desulfuricum TaxID=2055893 RepID=A0A343TJK8_9EURY|nr:hypothetical protein AArcSl_1651 [Halalkaliarchaeum desulfuricum]